MIELFRYLKSDFYKLCHSPFIWLHILFPICGAGLMALYAVFSSVGGLNRLLAFFQVMAIAFPFAVSIACEIAAGQEAGAGHCQNILMLSDRTKAIISKFLILILCGLFSAMFSSLIFGGILSVSHTDLKCTMRTLIMPSVILWSCSVLFYPFHLILAFRYGRNICIGAGVTGSLLAALMQTGLGTGLWYVLPYGFGIRLTDFTLRSVLHLYCSCSYNKGMDTEVEIGFAAVIIMTGILITIMPMWFSRYGGQRTAE